MKKYKNKFIISTIILTILVGIFWWGGNAPSLRGWNPTSNVPITTDIPDIDVTSTHDATSTLDTANTTNVTSDQTSVEDTTISPDSTSEPELTEPKDKGSTSPKSTGNMKPIPTPAADASSKDVKNGDANYSKGSGMGIDRSTGTDIYLTDPVPQGKPVPIEPQNVVISDKAFECTLSIQCNSILNNLNWLNPEKVELVPDNGVILLPTKVTFYEGESVFNVLLRETKKNKIHMEFTNTPIYNSAYIEGIHNLYEFDCGELSGWMYKVNDWFPNYGCSRYPLKDGDVIELVYTCDLGVDVGGHYAAKKQY